VENFQEHPQSILLTDSIVPHLRQQRPAGDFCIGQDSGIYWRLTDPPLRGALAPDWFVVLGVPPLLDGMLRRSYVLWQERVHPYVALEFVSRTGAEERDRTPNEGKFWIYENRIRPQFYGIYEVNPGRIEMYHLAGDSFVRMEPNERGRYHLPDLDVELGIWNGEYLGANLPWMRFFTRDGALLPTGHERADIERQRADRLAARLRALGADGNGE
jgi:Uma2 family endonuclease